MITPKDARLRERNQVSTVHDHQLVSFQEFNGHALLGRESITWANGFPQLLYSSLLMKFSHTSMKLHASVFHTWHSWGIQCRSL